MWAAASAPPRCARPAKVRCAQSPCASYFPPLPLGALGVPRRLTGWLAGASLLHATDSSAGAAPLPVERDLALCCCPFLERYVCLCVPRRTHHPLSTPNTRCWPGPLAVCDTDHGSRGYRQTAQNSRPECENTGQGGGGVLRFLVGVPVWWRFGNSAHACRDIIEEGQRDRGSPQQQLRCAAIMHTPCCCHCLQDLQESLATLGALPGDSIVAVELLWTPQVCCGVLVPLHLPPLHTNSVVLTTMRGR